MRRHCRRTLALLISRGGRRPPETRRDVARVGEDAEMAPGGPLLEPGEQSAAQARLGLVLDATARMAGNLDLTAVAQALVATVVPRFADRATVELVADV